MEICVIRDVPILKFIKPIMKGRMYEFHVSVAKACHLSSQGLITVIFPLSHFMTEEGAAIV